MTFALTEPSARFDSSGIETTAEADGDGYVLNGTKLFIPDAHVSDTILVAARAAGS
ncbi:MAG: acyl-CoA dehydrogenase, partial [Chloroflexi bacterium]|nr:acyl-CoA dehydrogenase [Chloroflexota bacterium]